MDRERENEHPYMDMLPDILPESISIFWLRCCVKLKSGFTNPRLPTTVFHGKVEEREFYIRIPGCHTNGRRGIFQRGR